MSSVWSKSLSLKFKIFSPSSIKDIKILKLEFVASIQFLKKTINSPRTLISYLSIFSEKSLLELKEHVFRIYLIPMKHFYGVYFLNVL